MKIDEIQHTIKTRRNIICLTPLHILLLAIGLIILRTPELFYEPRFILEEGSIYFAHMYHTPWYDALLTPHLGYYSLVNNLASLIAILLPLEYAPFALTYSAFFIQCAPFFIICYGSSSLWRTDGQKLLACSLVLLVAHPHSIWLNSITSQFHLSLIAFLILLDDTKNFSTKRSLTYSTLLILAGFTGVIACFLTPLFIIKAYIERTKIWYVFAAILIIASSIQLAITIDFFLHHGGSYKDTRFNNISIILTPMILLSNHIGGIFFHNHYILIDPGTQLLALIGNRFALLLPITSLLCIFMLLLYFARGLHRNDIIYTLGSFILISVLSTLSSMNGLGGPRYSYSTNVIFTLILASSLIAQPNTITVKKFLACLLIGTALIVGIHNHFNHNYLYDENWPKWHDEVQKWRNDKNPVLMTHPQFHDLQGMIQLDPHAH